jgi:hypothetical protein
VLAAAAGFPAVTRNPRNLIVTRKFPGMVKKSPPSESRASAETMPDIEEDAMTEELFAALFILSLFGQVLAVVVGFGLLMLPTKQAARSFSAVKEASAHA